MNMKIFFQKIKQELKRKRLSELANKLASDDSADFQESLKIALDHIDEGNRLGLEAIENALKIKSNNPSLTFFKPQFFAKRESCEINTAEQKLILLAENKSIHKNVELAGNLISIILNYEGYDSLLRIISDVKKVGGIDQFHSIQLIFNQIKSKLYVENKN